MNQVKLSGRVLKAEDKSKVSILRFMCRTNTNKCVFIDVMAEKGKFKKDDEIVIEGELSFMDKTEKFPAKLFINPFSIEKVEKEAIKDEDIPF